MPSFKVLSWRKVAVVSTLTAISGFGALLSAFENSVECSALVAHPPSLPWPHNGIGKSLDHGAVRRGYEVYKQVCSACHSLKYIRYRHMINVFLTEEEAKAEAAQVLIKTTDDNGQPITRPGMIVDGPPNPYPNNKAAAAANNGALPPDLSNMSLSRHNGDNYLVALLTGYFEAPAGVSIGDGKAYNPYFPGGVIAMPQQLYDGGIEFKDGTPATQVQQAKDVATFLCWCAQPEHDVRKKMALKALIFTPFLAIFLLYWKRQIFTTIKTSKTVFKSVRGREPPAEKSS